MGRPYKCPYCGESDTVSKGVRRTKTMGERRIRRCTACKRKFTPKNQKPGEICDGVMGPHGAQAGPAATGCSVTAETPAPAPVTPVVPAGVPQSHGSEVGKPDGPAA